MADGRAFRVAGANNYYLAFAPDSMVVPVFELARKMQLNVLRTWAFLDCGMAQPGCMPPGAQHGAYFQYWDPVAGAPVFNDGPTGLERLDRTIALAEQYEIRLILPLVNYWDDFGGMRQYLNWFGLSHRIEFYTHPQTRRAFKNYIEHMLSRVNTITGRCYCEEPSIFAWELANEPRCMSEDGTPAVNATGTLLDWIHEMSAHLKSIDPNHLVSAGDEGHFGTYGVDTKRILSVNTIDFGTCHYYPHFAAKKEPISFGRRWIRQRVAAAHRAGKPMLLEEYGWKLDPADLATSSVLRKKAFASWLSEIAESKGAGSLMWMIASTQADGKPYPDYDRYTIHSPEQVEVSFNSR